MHVGQALQGLEHNVSYHLLREKLASFSHQLIHVEVEVLKDEVERVLLEADLVQAHDVRMRQL